MHFLNDHQLGGTCHLLCATVEQSTGSAAPFASSALSRSGHQQASLYLSRFDISSLVALPDKALQCLPGAVSASKHGRATPGHLGAPQNAAAPDGNLDSNVSPLGPAIAGRRPGLEHATAAEMPSDAGIICSGDAAGNGAVLDGACLQGVAGGDSDRIDAGKCRGDSSLDVLAQVSAMLTSLRAHLDVRLDGIDERLAACHCRLQTLEHAKEPS